MRPGRVEVNWILKVGFATLSPEITRHAGIDSFVYLLRSRTTQSLRLRQSLFSGPLELNAYSLTTVGTNSAARLAGIGDPLKISQGF